MVAGLIGSKDVAGDVTGVERQLLISLVSVSLVSELRDGKMSLSPELSMPVYESKELAATASVMESSIFERLW